MRLLPLPFAPASRTGEPDPLSTDRAFCPRPLNRPADTSIPHRRPLAATFSPRKVARDRAWKEEKTSYARPSPGRRPPMPGSIQPFQPDDRADVLQVLAASLPSDPISSARFTRQVLLDANFRREGALVA